MQEDPRKRVWKILQTCACRARRNGIQWEKLQRRNGYANI